MRFSPLSWPLAFGSFMALAACSGPGSSAADSPAAAPPAALPQMASSGQPPRNQCNAQAAQFLVGQPYGPGTLEQARSAAGADEARMLRPDSMVTREYKVGRLNVVVETDHRVSRVHCG